MESRAGVVTYNVCIRAKGNFPSLQGMMFEDSFDERGARKGGGEEETSIGLCPLGLRVLHGRPLGEAAEAQRPPCGHSLLRT